MKSYVSFLRWLASPKPNKWQPLGKRMSIEIIRWILRTGETPKIPLYSKIVRILRSFSSILILPILTVFLVIFMAIQFSELKIYAPRDIINFVFNEAESIAIVSAAIIFVWEIQARKKREHYEAWQVITSAQGQRGNGGRIQALQDLNWDGISLEGVDISQAHLPKINLRWSKLIGARLEDANLRLSNLKGALLVEAQMKKALLFGSDLREANLCSAILEESDLSFVSLHRALLIEADCRGANFWGANLRDTSFHLANLEEADLRDANLANARLEGANLKNAKFGRHPNFGVETFQIGGLGTFKMTECSLRNISWDQYTNWDGVQGLETTDDVPLALLEQLGLVQKGQDRKSNQSS